MNTKKNNVNYLHRLGLLVVLSVLSACQVNSSLVPSSSAASTTVGASKFPDRPKNIILMIGDGMGLSQISAALYSNKNRLNLEAFNVIGFHKSYAYGELVTDSAAGATAFACGIKTYNGSIGMTKDTIPIRNIIEEAEESGLATGLVATSFIVHATPAAFIAHQAIRVQYEEIAADMLDVEVDLLIGGGKKYFDRREKDDRDLYRELQLKGYYVNDYSRIELQQINLKNKKKVVFFTADRHPVPVSAGRDYLPYASRLAPLFLKESNEDKGFFLMIEGSQIDWACHGNEGDLAIKETLDFDRAVGEVLKFAEKDRNTLVIVTADHETGGMALNPGSKPGKIEPAFTTNGHTAALVPVFAYGPGAEHFAGIYENTDIHKKMRMLLGFTEGKDANALKASSNSR